MKTGVVMFLDNIQPLAIRVWFLDRGQTVSPESERWTNSQPAIEFGRGLLSIRVAKEKENEPDYEEIRRMIHRQLPFSGPHGTRAQKAI